MRRFLRRSFVGGLPGVLVIAAAAASQSEPVNSPKPTAATVSGWVRTDEGDAASEVTLLPRSGVRLLFRDPDGNESAVLSERSGRGEILGAELNPGIYDLVVPQSNYHLIPYTPELIHGLVLHPGSNRLELVVHRGSTLWVAGHPTVTTAAEQDTGRLEGTIQDTHGAPVWGAPAGLVGLELRLRREDGRVTIYAGRSRLNVAGLYQIRNIPPGTYELSVPKGYSRTAELRPQQLRRVVIRKGQLAWLPILMRPGRRTESITPQPSYQSIELSKPAEDGGATKLPTATERDIRRLRVSSDPLHTRPLDRTVE